MHIYVNALLNNSAFSVPLSFGNIRLTFKRVNLSTCIMALSWDQNQPKKKYTSFESKAPPDYSSVLICSTEVFCNCHCMVIMRESDSKWNNFRVAVSNPCNRVSRHS